MLDATDLPTPQQRAYYERIKGLALARCDVIIALQAAHDAERRGELDEALSHAADAAAALDDVSALYEDWKSDLARIAADAAAGSGSTSLGL